MSDITTLIALAAAIIGIALYFWYRRWSKVFVAGGVDLNPNEEYEFFFLATFDNESDARHCSEITQYPGLNAIVKPTPNNKFWSIHWSITIRAYGPKVRALQHQLEAAASSCRGKILTSSASKPNAYLTAEG